MSIFQKHKGAILVMSLLIGSAITIVGVEVAMFVLSSIRQSRTIDHSTIAYYAAESGTENVMHQVRKENLLSFADLRKTTETIEGATWSIQEYQEPQAVVGVFRDSIDELQRATLRANDSFQASFYKKSGQAYNAVPSLKSMKVAWSSEVCPGQRPSMEMTAVEFEAGATINWNSPATQLKKDIQVTLLDDPGTPQDESAIREVFFNFVKEDGSPINKPMVVRVKAFFCDLSGVKATLYKGLDGTGDQLNIPNYFYINPRGAYAGVSRDELKSTFAAHDAAASVFDFVLFSQDQVVK